jgi:TPR repeat protein
MRLRVAVAALLIGASASAFAASAPVDPNRFGERPADSAYGAFQRGLYITALNLALPRAKDGDGAAMVLAAEIYARGLGVPRNEASAAEWYGKAAEAGMPEAQLQYALIMLDGKHAKPDIPRVRELLKSAADAGNRQAQFNYAQFLFDRERSDDAQKLAVDYYEKAAKAGLADAQYAMSQAYAAGTGGRKADDVEARRWMALAAAQNYDTAQVDLGTWLVEGRGGKRDMKAGFGWIRTAAVGGNVAAQNRLAKLYVEGLGVDPDIIEGTAWYIVAKREGLADVYMDDVIEGLTPEQQKQAIERANRLR